MPKVVYTSKKGLRQESGSGVNWNGETCQGDYRQVIAFSGGTTTLSTNDSGCLVKVTANTSGGKVVLPAVADAKGFYLDLHIHDTWVDHDMKIETSSTDSIHLLATSANNATAASNGTAHILIEADGEIAGDRVHVVCDGVKWYARAFSTAAATFLAAS
jgi:hypothetical protein